MTKKHLITGVITLCLMSLLVAPVVLATACSVDDPTCVADLDGSRCIGGDGNAATPHPGTCGCTASGHCGASAAGPYCYDDDGDDIKTCHAVTQAVAFPGSAYVNAEMDIMETATKVIDAIMAFLGIIAVVIVLIGGFQWMTAAGNEDKVKTAKKTLSAGIVGIVIVLAAWGIARFVVSLLAKV